MDSTFVNNTALEVYIQPPNGKVIWLVMGGMLTNGDNVGRNTNIYLVDFEAQTTNCMLLHSSAGLGAGAGTPFPNYANTTTYAAPMFPIVLQYREALLRCRFSAGGASAGGTAVQYFYVLEVMIG